MINKVLVLYEPPPINNPAVTGIMNRTPDEALGVFGSMIGSIVGIMLVIATIWVLIQLLQGGLMWINSGGDKTTLESARNRITNAVIGLIIIFAVWALFIVILQFLGIGIIGPNGEIKLKIPSLI